MITKPKNDVYLVLVSDLACNCISSHVLRSSSLEEAAVTALKNELKSQNPEEYDEEHVEKGALKYDISSIGPYFEDEGHGYRVVAVYTADQLLHLVHKMIEC